MVYIIDAADRIIHLDNDWAKCAAESGEASLAPERLLGRSLWSFLKGVETIHLYRLLVRRARRGAQIGFRLRMVINGNCQLMQMRMTVVGVDSVVFETNPVEASPSDPPLPVLPSMMVVCSWCDRLKMSNQTWTEAENAVAQLGLFERETLPQMTHGVCEDCYRELGGDERRQHERISHRFVDFATHTS